MNVQFFEKMLAVLLTAGTVPAVAVAEPYRLDITSPNSINPEFLIAHGCAAGTAPPPAAAADIAAFVSSLQRNGGATKLHKGVITYADVRNAFPSPGGDATTEWAQKAFVYGKCTFYNP
jgi:hypothetical protein